MRTLAIGDIHGCYRALTSLEALVGFSTDDQIITLGDYVDRGPDSRAVLEWLLERYAMGNLIPLRGNHELMMVAARCSESQREQWLESGGDAALASYAAERLDLIPETHWRFLSDCLRPYYETATHVFVHANAYPDTPLADQPDYMLYWEPLRDPAPHFSGLTMICGHTPQRTGLPLDLGHAVCIDTWAYGRGWLTCLDIGSRFCWQANESGDTRRFWLDEGP